MLPKINRIKKKKDFEIIFKNSKSFKNNLFIFKIMKNNLGLNRFGFVVSQKVSKKATVRNKTRRRLAEAIRARIKDIYPVKSAPQSGAVSREAGQFNRVKIGTDLVLIALPGIERKEFSEIKETINNMLIKSGLIAG